MKEPKITVVGSINMDLLTGMSKMPQQGETLVGNDFAMKPGGKGANQAVAAARLGADVKFIGKVGDDALGVDLLSHMKQEGIDIKYIDSEKGKSTGIANVLLYDKDNRIIFVSGANEAVTADDVARKKDVLLGSDIVIMQMEIPIETIIWCVEFCYENNIPVIVNPAPATDLPNEIWEKCTFITPNEAEAKQLGLNQFSDKLITTLGSQGAQYRDSTIATYQANVVDTTGAGDTFNGTLAYYIATGYQVEDAILRANAAASLAIEKLGAQEGMPTRERVEERLAEM